MTNIITFISELNNEMDASSLWSWESGKLKRNFILSNVCQIFRFFFFWLSLKQPVSKAFFQRHSEGLDQEPLSNGPVEATRNIHQYLWNVL